MMSSAKVARNLGDQYDASDAKVAPKSKKGGQSKQKNSKCEMSSKKSESSKVKSDKGLWGIASLGCQNPTSTPGFKASGMSVESPNLSPMMNHSNFFPQMMRGMKQINSPFGSPTLSRRSFGSDSFCAEQSDTVGGVGAEDVDSNRSSPTGSQSSFNYSVDSIKRRYKDELWSAIKSDYRYLMDDEIIETCKSTESDLSMESDEASSQTEVMSFKEFLQQYIQLVDWLSQMQQHTPRKGVTYSEYYLNQMHYVELLEHAPTRQAFNDSAHLLMRRHPQLREEIQMRLDRLNCQWNDLEKLVEPSQELKRDHNILQDIESDIIALSQWINKTESVMNSLRVQPHWTVQQLTDKLNQQKILHSDIEHHSKIVSTVLTLCERLRKSDVTPATLSGERCNAEEVERDGVQAVGLERRCHALWILSIEWQMRLEEFIHNGPPYQRTVNDDSMTSDDDQWDVLSVKHAMLLQGGSLNPQSDYNRLDRDDSFRPADMSACESETSGSDISENSRDSLTGKGFPRSEAIRIPGVRKEREYDADSALGRSYSDPSLSESVSSGRRISLGSGRSKFGNMMEATVIPCEETMRTELSGDNEDGSGQRQVDEEEDVSGDFSLSRSAGELDDILRKAQGGKLRKVETIDLQAAFQDVGKVEGQDVGNSSENPTTDEQDIGRSVKSPEYMYRERTNIIDGRITEEDEEFVNDGRSDVDDIAAEQKYDERVQRIHSASSAYNTSSENGSNLDGGTISSSAAVSKKDVYQLQLDNQLQLDKLPEDLADWTHKDLSQRTEDDLSESMDLPLDDMPVIVFAPGTLGRIVLKTSRSLDSLSTICNQRFLNRIDPIITKKQNGHTKANTEFENPRDKRQSSDDIDVGTTRRMTKKKSFVGHDTLSSCDASSEATSSGSEWCVDHVMEKQGRSARRHAGRRTKHISSSDECLRGDVERQKHAVKRGRLDSGSTGSSSGTECNQEFASDTDTDGTEDVKPKVRRTTPPSSMKCSYEDKERRRRKRQTGGGEGKVESCEMTEEGSDAQIVPENGGEKRKKLRDVLFDEECWYQEQLWDDSLDLFTDDSMGGKSFLTTTDDEWRFDNSCVEDENGLDLAYVRPVVKNLWSAVNKSEEMYETTQSRMRELYQDHIEGTAVHEPTEFIGLLDKCDVGLKSLQTAVQAAVSCEDKSRLLSDALQQAKNVTLKWEELRTSIVIDQSESHDLYSLFCELFSVEKCLGRITTDLNLKVDQFDSAQEIDEALNVIQSLQTELTEIVEQQLRGLDEHEKEFAVLYPALSLAVFKEHVTSIKQAATILTLQCKEDTARLQLGLFSWQTFSLMYKELMSTLGQERHQLDCLTAVNNVVDFTESDRHETVVDLQVMQDGRARHEEKLSSLSRLSTELMSVCSQQAYTEHCAVLQSSHAELMNLKAKCSELVMKLKSEQQSRKNKEEEDVSQRGREGKRLVEEVIRSDGNGLAEKLRMDKMNLTSGQSSPSAQQGKLTVLRRLLKYTLPLPLALLVVLGGWYMMDENMCEVLGSYGLTLYPEMQHVRGPPPI